MHKMTDERRQLFLDGHNERRNQLAMGKLQRQIKKLKNNKKVVTGHRDGVFTGRTAVDIGQMVSTETRLHLITCLVLKNDIILK